MEWQYYEQCCSIFGHTALATPVSMSSSIAAAETRQVPVAETSQSCAAESIPNPVPLSQSPPSSLLLLGEDEDTQQTEGVVTEANIVPDTRTEGIATTPNVAVEETQAGPSQRRIPGTTPLRGNIYNVPVRRRRPNKTEQASRIMTTVLAEKLEQMDAAMAAREDARLERFLQAQQDMNNSLMAHITMDTREYMREMQSFQTSLFEKMFAMRERPHTMAPQQPPTNIPQHYPHYGPSSYYDQTQHQHTHPQFTHPPQTYPQYTQPPQTHLQYTQPPQTHPQYTQPPQTHLNLTIPHIHNHLLIWRQLLTLLFTGCYLERLLFLLFISFNI
ncbi:uncharacterized protein LOC135057015 [Pseudophryne corroboree]|uniref:uncharacterized protein LOC135057015 n=1 Tax=Pseudophryne corroboree TaxID=495146 RepID=UPI003081E718